MSEKPVAYVSAPGYNDPQKIVYDKITQVLEEQGFEPFVPMVESEVPPVEEAQKCLAALQNADLVVASLDGLSPQGISLYLVGNVQDQVNLNLPPEIVEDLQIAAIVRKKHGKERSNPHKAIITPGEMNSPPPVPTSLTINYGEHGMALCALLGRPVNYPDISVVFELGYAVSARKPVIGLGLVDPVIGMYLGWAVNAWADTFDSLGNILGAYKEHAKTGNFKDQREALSQINKKLGNDVFGEQRKKIVEAQRRQKEANEVLESSEAIND